MTRRALIVVDVQNDFISGSLSLSNCPSKHDGGQVVPLINRLVKETKFDLIVFTQDWHPTDHISFVDNVHLRTFHDSCNKKSDQVKVRTRTEKLCDDTQLKRIPIHRHEN